MERLHRATSRAITGCLSSSPIPLLHTGASLSPLRVTLTHFTLLSYERAIRLSTSFPISDLARLGVKPRLCRSSWRAFASTHPLMLRSTCSREALFACPLFSLGICLPSRLSPSFPFHVLALIPLTLANVRLWPILTLSPHITWYSGLTALFLFLLARAAPAFLPTALSVALRPLFPFRQAVYVQVFPLKPAPFCTLFAGPGSTNKSAIFLLFSSYLTLVLSSPSCPLLHLFSHLKLYGRSGRNCPSSPPVLSGYNGSPETRFSRGTTRLMSWPDEDRCLRPPQSLVVSLLLSLVSTFVISRTGGVLSHRSILTHRFPRFPLRNLCCLVMLAVSSLVFAATDTAFFYVLIFLGLAESRILLAAPGDTRPRTSHSALSSYGLFAPLTLWRLSVSPRPLVQTVGICPASGAPWFSAMPPSLGRGRVTSNNNSRTPLWKSLVQSQCKKHFLKHLLVLFMTTQTKRSFQTTFSKLSYKSLLALIEKQISLSRHQ